MSFFLRNVFRKSEESPLVFSSSIFLFIFLPLVLFLYFIVRAELRNFVLLAFSLIFYAWGEPRFVLFNALFHRIKLLLRPTRASL